MANAWFDYLRQSGKIQSDYLKDCPERVADIFVPDLNKIIDLTLEKSRARKKSGGFQPTGAEEGFYRHMYIPKKQELWVPPEPLL